MSWRKQFAKPTGLKGWLAGQWMAWRNRAQSEWVLSLLPIEEADSILEIGFGPGRDLARVAERARHGYVAGVDHSTVMLRMAARRNAEAILQGRMELFLSSAQRLPFPAERFDKAYSINTAQFWEDSQQAFAELYRILRPGGLAVVAVQPRGEDATEEKAIQTGEELVRCFRQAGFHQVRLERKKMRPVSCVCATGVKPGQSEA